MPARRKSKPKSAVSNGTDHFAPGSREYVRLVLREPLLLLPGDRFIVRKFSPVVTIGGGVVLDIAPPRRATARPSSDS